ncbi:MAG TPA: hypothetical protein VKA08_14715, partial [Balneolales bacterium]|nr:hypothetical protein [Balneolales bacterium]
PYLQPWFSLPDVTVFDASTFFGRKEEGKNEEGAGFGDRGVKTAGFFGLDWSLKNGEFVEK